MLGGLLGGADKKGPTTQERNLSNIAGDKFERYEEFFEPLNRKAEKRAEDSREDFLRGRANADTMQAVSGVDVDGNGEVSTTGRSGLKALSDGLRAASNQDDTRQLQQRSNNLSTRSGQGQQAIQGLSDSAQIATERTLNDLELEMKEQKQKEDLLGSAIGAGAGYMQNQKIATEQAKEEAIGNLGGGTTDRGYKRTIGTGGSLTGNF